MTEYDNLKNNWTKQTEQQHNIFYEKQNQIAMDFLKQSGYNITGEGIQYKNQFVKFKDLDERNTRLISNYFSMSNEGNFGNFRSVNLFDKYTLNLQKDDSSQMIKRFSNLFIQEPTAGDLLKDIQQMNPTSTKEQIYNRVYSTFPSVKDDIDIQDKILYFEKQNNLTTVTKTSDKIGQIGDIPELFKQRQMTIPLMLIAGVLLIGMTSK